MWTPLTRECSRSTVGEDIDADELDPEALILILDGHLRRSSDDYGITRDEVQVLV